MPPAPRRVIPGRSMGGSLEHFYHFMLSYFLPIDAYIARHHPDALDLRDCGPMNVWFGLFAPGTRISVRPRPSADEGAGAGAGAGKVQAARISGADDETVIVATLESQYRPRRRTIRAARKRILERLDLPLTPTKEGVTLINRAPSLPFYETDAVVKTSGAQRRSIPNFQALSEAIGRVVPVHTFEGEHLDPVSQVTIMSQTTILIGQHGAGLAHMVFMAPGGVVIEILPSKLRFLNVGKFFRTLARSCGHSYVVVTQDKRHSPVDVSQVLTALATVRAARS